jgi:hypothetical protein
LASIGLVGIWRRWPQSKILLYLKVKKKKKKKKKVDWEGYLKVCACIGISDPIICIQNGFPDIATLCSFQVTTWFHYNIHFHTLFFDQLCPSTRLPCPEKGRKELGRWQQHPLPYCHAQQLQDALISLY